MPNILIIVNHDAVSLYDDFAQPITGEIGDLGPVSEAVRDKIPEINAYVWIDASGRTAAQPQRLFRHQSRYANCCSLVDAYGASPESRGSAKKRESGAPFRAS